MDPPNAHEQWGLAPSHEIRGIEVGADSFDGGRMRSFARLGTLVSSLLLMALACSLPVGVPPSETPPSAALTPTEIAPETGALEPLAPAVIETVPTTGEELDPGGSLTLYFDQPMDAASVEAAFDIQPPAEGTLDWPRPDSLRFTPSHPLQQDTTYQINLAPAARAATGMSLSEALSLSFHTAGFIEVAQVVPEAGTDDVDPGSVITVVFNRPIVPLQFEGELPQPISFDPAVEGSGEWIDTGVYVFHPKAGLAGGVRYTATVPAGLTDVAGGVLQETYSWSFSTSLPRLISITPLDNNQPLGLLDPIVLAFNQAMDAESVAESFSVRLSGSTTDVPGDLQWDDASSEATFTPDEPFAYGTAYTLELSTEARAADGAFLADPVQAVFRTVPSPSVSSTTPANGGTKNVYSSVEFTFSAPMDRASLVGAVHASPSLENQGTYWQADTNSLIVYGDFKPSTFYRITIATTAQDPFSTPLAEPFELTFTTGHLPAQVDFTRFSEVVTLSSGRDPQTELQARNISRIDLALYDLTLDEFQSQLQSGAYLYRNPTPTGSLRRQWSVVPSLAQDVTKIVSIPLQADPLPSGAYMLTVRSPEDENGTRGRLILVRDTELVFKATTTEGFVWAVDLASGSSVTGLPIRIVDEQGADLGSGRTGDDGTVTISIPPQDDPYARLYAVSGSPGVGRFGWTGSHWSSGTEPYEFGIPLDPSPPEFFIYLYTDRPIYRPGQTVSYRGIMRHVSGARYDLPDLAQVDLQVRDAEGKVIHQGKQTLTSYGTFDDQFNLDDDASLGTYIIQTDFGILTFDVAAYRKPEFTVDVTPSSTDVAMGDPLTASIDAQYYFGGPVAGGQVQWSAWASPLNLSGLPQPIDWLSGVSSFAQPFGYGTFADGEGTTDENGRLTIVIPTDDMQVKPAQVTIEATLTDSSGLPVTGRGVANVHPAMLYLGVVPASYTLRSGQTAEVKATAVDWGGEPLPGQPVDLTVDRITWSQTVNDAGQITWEQQATTVNRGEGVTADDGAVRFSFQPSTGGTYRIRAAGVDPTGRTATGEATVWVSGSGGGIWRQPSAGKIALVADHDRYDPGDTARVLVPSPFTGPATALVTIERSSVLSHQILQIRPDSSAIEIPISDTYAPNVFLSVTLIRPGSADEPPAIAVGMLTLPVNRSQLELQVSLTPSAQKVGPGESVSYRLQALDASGDPVQAEFSMALTDLAALSLAEPNSLPPADAFYGNQPLRVRSGASLALTGEVGFAIPQAEGIGGGGGEAATTTVRSEFPDTAYWNASVVTDEDGLAEVELTLPDSLTTWRMDARGVTDDTRVGAATTDIVATKPLLIRPETPRFFTAGDAASVAAVVHNNTSGSLPLEALLVASGAEITSSPDVSFTLAAGQSHRVEWGLTIQDTDAVDLTFHVSGGGLEDASKPTIGSASDGSLPVLRYAAPQTAATAGSLGSGEARVEALSLPRTYNASQGELRVEADPSLGSAMASALTVLDNYPYQSTEQIVSRFLSNLVFYNALGRYGLGDDTQRSRLERTLDQSLQSLYNQQLSSGGWGWWISGPADSYITAYVVFGLAEAQAYGLSIDQTALDEAISFVQSSIVPTGMLSTAQLRNRQVFLLYCLEAAGEGDLASLHQLSDQRDTLSVWAEGLLATSLADLSPNDPALDGLRSDLETAATRSATGASWQDQSVDRWNLGSSVRTTAQVLQALLTVDPENPLVANGVRWLLAARSRDGSWASSHETAWAMLALTQWLDAQGGLQANFEYQISLNGRTLTQGQADPGALLTSVTLTEPIADLFPDQPNQLSFRRGTGSGTLFYTAHLTVYRPIEDVPAQSRGLSVLHRYFYYDGHCGTLDEPCAEATSASVGDDILVRVSLIVPSDQYYVIVEDPFPAGMEPIDRGLSTSPVDLSTSGGIASDTFQSGLGWWRFIRAELRDDRLALFADYLPAGTYQYDYVLHATFAGEYRVLPTTARALYFPEVYGQAAGTVYTIKP
jgi:uncharacterized protein YfaS (alpha-2-macroglobulin family)